MPHLRYTYFILQTPHKLVLLVFSETGSHLSRQKQQKVRGIWETQHKTLAKILINDSFITWKMGIPIAPVSWESCEF